MGRTPGKASFEFSYKVLKNKVFVPVSPWCNRNQVELYSEPKNASDTQTILIINKVCDAKEL